MENETPESPEPSEQQASTEASSEKSVLEVNKVPSPVEGGTESIIAGGQRTDGEGTKRLSDEG